MRQLLHEQSNTKNEGLLDMMFGEPKKVEKSDLEKLVGKEIEIEHEELGRFKSEVRGYLDRKSTYALFMSIPDSLRNDPKLRDYMAKGDELAKAGLGFQKRLLKISPDKVREGRFLEDGERINEDDGQMKKSGKPKMTFEKHVFENQDLMKYKHAIVKAFHKYIQSGDAKGLKSELEKIENKIAQDKGGFLDPSTDELIFKFGDESLPLMVIINSLEFDDPKSSSEVKELLQKAVDDPDFLSIKLP